MEFESQRKLAESIDRNMKEIKVLYDRIDEENNFNKKYAFEMNRQYEEAHHKALAI